LNYDNPATMKNQVSPQYSKKAVSSHLHYCSCIKTCSGWSSTSLSRGNRFQWPLSEPWNSRAFSRQFLSKEHSASTEECHPSAPHCHNWQHALTSVNRMMHNPQANYTSSRFTNSLRWPDLTFRAPSRPKSSLARIPDPLLSCTMCCLH
jgi:hypothetical protein